MPLDHFADVRDKRMSELNDEQKDRAHELWLREQMGLNWPLRETLEAVLRVTDRLRGGQAAIPGMAVQGLAGEIVAALLADEQDGGYDLEAGMFGPNFSALVRRWAAAEWRVVHPMDVDELCGLLSKASEHCALGEPDQVQSLIGEAIRYVRACEVPAT